MLNWMNAKYKEIKPAPQQAQEQPKASEHHETTQTPPSDLISASQVTLVKTLWGKTGLPEEKIREYLKTTFKVTSTKELTKTQASDFIKYLQETIEFSGSSGAKAPVEEKMPREE
jgi:hypothetical protein